MPSTIIDMIFITIVIIITIKSNNKASGMSRYAIDTIHGVACSKHLCFLSPLEYNANPVKA